MKEYDAQFTRFHDLMKFRVREILLVATPYDSFVLEEDGRLTEKIFNEYLDLNLQFVPRISHASSANEAFEALKTRTYDLVITMPRISDMDSLEFGRLIKETYPGKPVVMLTYETLDNEMMATIRKTKSIDRVFYWSGDSKILLAIVKYIEDLGNVEEDSQQGVQVILVVDDSPKYQSQFLPIIYTEIMKQTSYLISHAVNDLHRLLRMRARPKILLSGTFEESLEIIHKYQKNLLGIISDVGFPKDGVLNPTAGLELAKRIKEEIPDLPILLQSEEPINARKAKEIGINFLDKNSKNLLIDFRNYILDNYSFGAFVFKTPQGKVISTASDTADFEREIKVLPDESLIYHAIHNDFSRWFRARTEFEIADELRERKVSASENVTEFRRFMLDCLDRFYRRYQKGVIIDFGLSKMNMENSFVKLGSGSLGGKARSVAFFRFLLAKSDLREKYSGVKIKTPCSFVICSDVFDEFMQINNLQQMAVNSTNEQEIVDKFLMSKLPVEITENLRALVKEIDYPLAVRSSNILEDSQILPFAGIYKTYMLPNCAADPSVRLKQLSDAIKQVYASVFLQSSKRYATNADLSIEEGMMAVLIQQLVGEQHDDLFYPVISGTAQTYNYYPYSYMKPEQGVVSLALGLGKAIVDDSLVYSFSPAYPEMNPPFLSPEEYIKNTQSRFYALDLSQPSKQITIDDSCTYRIIDLKRTEQDQTLQLVASTYSAEEDLITDSFEPKGRKIVTFAPILKYNTFPLVDIVNDLFRLGKSSFGTDVEIEFAVNIPIDRNKQPEFYFLQIRPMVVGGEACEVRIDDFSPENVICTSVHTIGNGAYQNISDIIYLDPDHFELNKTEMIASEIGELNKLLINEGRKCALIGFGRIGTSEPWLGIPLEWWQMSQAKVVVEAEWGKLIAEPSMGSHFYHNLTSLKMGYYHIDKKSRSEEYINWDNLKQAVVVHQTEHARLVRFKKPLIIKIDGQSNRGVILTQE